MQKRELIKANNRGKVMEIIRNKRVVYRAELMRMTGLSMPTIMKITDGFIQAGLVVDAGKGESSGGKPPVLLEIVPQSRLFIGMDISGAKFKCIIMDLCGDIVYQKFCLRRDLNMKESVTETIIEFIEDTIREAGIDRSKLSGLGLSVPGIVEAGNGIVIASIDYNWKNKDLCTPLSEHFGIPTFIENSSRTMAVGEKWFGKGEKSDNFALVTIGHGIGAAFIINGEIYDGFYKLSGEVGHMVIDPNGPVCKCGKRGCLETFASGNAIKMQAISLGGEAEDSKILELVNGEKEKIDVDIVFKAESAGDPLASKIIDNAIRYLTIGLENLISILDCKLVVLSGYVVKDNDWFAERVKKRINDNRQLYYGDKPIDVKLSALGEEAAVIGAAMIPLRNWVISGDESSRGAPCVYVPYPCG